MSLSGIYSSYHWGHAALQVTTDIYDDAERQNLVLDETVCLLLLCAISYS